MLIIFVMAVLILVICQCLLEVKRHGNGLVIMINAAPYMNANLVPQYDFIAKAVKHIAIKEGWGLQ